MGYFNSGATNPADWMPLLSGVTRNNDRYADSLPSRREERAAADEADLAFEAWLDDLEREGDTNQD